MTIQTESERAAALADMIRDLRLKLAVATAALISIEATLTAENPTPAQVETIRGKVGDVLNRLRGIEMWQFADEARRFGQPQLSGVDACVTQNCGTPLESEPHLGGKGENPGKTSDPGASSPEPNGPDGEIPVEATPESRATGSSLAAESGAGPAQWRELGPDEVIQVGDEWACIDEEDWERVQSCFEGDKPPRYPMFRFRRRVSQPDATGDRQEYVLGFMFRPEKDRVALIRKSKPEWQRGKLNGIGGKVENESKYTAMVREFREETGVETHGQQWEYFCRLEGSAFSVHCFTTVGDVYSCKTMEQEDVKIVDVNEIDNRRNPPRPQMVENLPWLIHLAIDCLEDNRPGFTVASYDEPHPFGPCPRCAQLERDKAELVEALKQVRQINASTDGGQIIMEGRRGMISDICVRFIARHGKEGV